LKRLKDDQISFLFQAFTLGLIARFEVQKILSVGISRFFAALKEYKIAHLVDGRFLAH
jgi:hypothetical protein